MKKDSITIKIETFNTTFVVDDGQVEETLDMIRKLKEVEV